VTLDARSLSLGGFDRHVALMPTLIHCAASRQDIDLVTAQKVRTWPHKWRVGEAQPHGES
jgi:hypothetical protein